MSAKTFYTISMNSGDIMICMKCINRSCIVELRKKIYLRGMGMDKTGVWWGTGIFVRYYLKGKGRIVHYEKPHLCASPETNLVKATIGELLEI